jgi:ABC-2 type transport system ATP-binding protein
LSIDAGPVLELQDVAVHYGNVVALPGLTLQVEARGIGLLGPNGAGKSSLLKAILGLVKPVRGQIEVLGLSLPRDALELRRRVGYMPESAVYFPGMTGFENVSYAGLIAGMPRGEARRRAHEVLEYVGMGEERYRPADGYSTGMRQRVKLSCALVHDPDLLLLDEPTNGLDPKGRTEVLQLISDLSREKGLIVLLSSHLLDDVESVCDHIMVLQRGELKVAGDLREMKQQLTGSKVQLQLLGDPEPFLKTVEENGWTVILPDPLVRGECVIQIPEGVAAPELLALARQVDCQVRRFEPREPSLEDVFLNYLQDGESSTVAGSSS